MKDSRKYRTIEFDQMEYNKLKYEKYRPPRGYEYTGQYQYVKEIDEWCPVIRKV